MGMESAVLWCSLVADKRNIIQVAGCNTVDKKNTNNLKSFEYRKIICNLSLCTFDYKTGGVCRDSYCRPVP